MNEKYKTKLWTAASLEAAMVAWDAAARALDEEASKCQQGSGRKKAVAVVLRHKIGKAEAWLNSFYSGGEYVPMPIEVLE